MTEKFNFIKRKQLTLFLSENVSAEIESCREKFNLEQFKLIKAHITLCRENEICQFEKISENLSNLCFESFFLEFGKPIRFFENKGVLMPVIGNELIFQNLRKEVLRGVINSSSSQKPHITLMHPRNSICTNEIFDEITEMNFPRRISFSKISLIEQTLGEKWTILKEYKLKNTI